MINFRSYIDSMLKTSPVFISFIAGYLVFSDDLIEARTSFIIGIILSWCFASIFDSLFYEKK